MRPCQNEKHVLRCIISTFIVIFFFCFLVFEVLNPGICSEVLYTLLSLLLSCYVISCSILCILTVYVLSLLGQTSFSLIAKLVYDFTSAKDIIYLVFTLICFSNLLLQPDCLDDLAYAIMYEMSKLCYRVSEADVIRAQNQVLLYFFLPPLFFSFLFLTSL